MSERVLREVLSKRDPQGYYIVPAAREGLKALSKELLEQVLVEEAGDVVLIRTKSRRVAEAVARILLSKGYLRT